MLRSMTSAISGMRNHQIAMDVVGTNIANVNTVGYKAETASFKEAIYQSYSKGSAPLTDGSLGGTNPIQVGLGVNMGGISTNMTQGSVTNTGVGTNLMIQGDGFFVLGNGGAAVPPSTQPPTAFTRDGSFALDSEGYLVDPVTGYYVLDSTATVALGGNTPGNTIMIPSTWKSYSIGADGLITGVDAAGALSYVTAGGGTDTNPANGLRVGIAKFPNPQGLVKAGGNYYQMAADSGYPTISAPANSVSGTGSILSGSLEASNVDLAEQFSKMIMAQRGFQANSRVITTSDSMLEELVNLKR